MEKFNVLVKIVLKLYEDKPYTSKQTLRKTFELLYEQSELLSFSGLKHHKSYDTTRFFINDRWDQNYFDPQNLITSTNNSTGTITLNNYSADTYPANGTEYRF
jgi:hypothetical protein